MSSTATTSSNGQPKTAKEVIAANVQALIEQLEAGHSDALTAYGCSSATCLLLSRS